MDLLDRYNSPYGADYQLQQAEANMTRRKEKKLAEAQERIAANQAAQAASGVHSSGVQLPPWAMAQAGQGGAPAPRASTPPPKQLELHKRAPQQQMTQQQALSNALREGA